MSPRRRTPQPHPAYLYSSPMPQPQVWGPGTPYPNQPTLIVTSPTPVVTPMAGTPFHASMPMTPAPSLFAHPPPPAVFPAARVSPGPAPYAHWGMSPHNRALAKAREDVHDATANVERRRKDLARANEKLARERAAAVASPYTHHSPIGLATPVNYMHSPSGYPALPLSSPYIGAPPPPPPHGTPYCPHPYTPGAPNVALNVPPYSHLTVDGLHGCNVYVNSAPSYTPAPSYVNLSPPPMAYADIGAPEDIEVDRWEMAKSSYLFDNRISPIELNSQRHSLEINPLLELGESPLLVDLSRRKEDVAMRNEPGVRWRDEDDAEEKGSQPATLPRVTRLRLVSPKVRSKVEVTNAHGVTVNDVLAALFRSFHTQLDPIADAARDELEALRRNSAYHANAQHQLYGTWSPYLRRVDLLMSEPIFAGLTADPDMALERYGEKDCAMMIMNFAGRDDLE